MNITHDHAESNWHRALEARELWLLEWIVQIVIAHERQTGGIISASQLKATIERGQP